VGYLDNKISVHRDNRISNFRRWQACGIGRACSVVKAGGTVGVGRAGEGSKAGKAGGAGKLGELGELGELEARAGGKSSPAWAYVPAAVQVISPAEVELPVRGHVARREVTLPGGRSWCQAGGHGASQMSGCQASRGSGVGGSLSERMTGSQW